MLPLICQRAKAHADWFKDHSLLSGCPLFLKGSLMISGSRSSASRGPVQLAFIVEGHAEDSALPRLAHRVIQYLDPSVQLRTAGRPFRLPRGRVVKTDELLRSVEKLAHGLPRGGGILIVFDADDSPTCVLGPQIQRWVNQARPDLAIGVVLAEREIEAWVLAALPSLAGVGCVPADVIAPDHPETIRGYRATLHLAPMFGALDVDQGRRGSRSFDKFVREVARVCGMTPPPQKQGESQ